MTLPRCLRRASLALLACATAPLVEAQTIYVDGNAAPPGNGTLASPYTTILDGLSHAGNSGTVRVAPGTYFENISVTGLRTVIADQGPLVTVIHGNGVNPVVTLNGTCDCALTLPRVEGFTITSGPPPGALVGAVVSNEGLLARCIVTDNPGAGYTCVWDGYVERCTFAGNPTGVQIGVFGVARFDRVALGNNGSNLAATGGTWTNSVGSGTSVPSGLLNAEPGFWNPANDFHLRPGSPAATMPGGYAGAVPPDANYAPPSFAFCYGDGTLADHTTACPCGNDGGPGRGCATSFNPAGAVMASDGKPSNDDVTLEASGMASTAFGVFLQHAGTGDQIFHDGVLCAGGSLLRLRNRAAVGGVARFPDPSYPIDATTTLSQRGQVTPGSGATRYYSLFYRSPAASFCPPATANVTNGWTVVW